MFIQWLVHPVMEPLSIYLATTLPEHQSSRHLQPSLMHMPAAKLSTGQMMGTLSSPLVLLTSDILLDCLLSRVVYPPRGSITSSDLPRKETDRRTNLGKRIIDLWVPFVFSASLAGIPVKLQLLLIWLLTSTFLVLILWLIA